MVGYQAMMKPETPLQQGDAAIDHHPTVVDLEAHVLNPMVNQELESRSMSSRHGGTVMKFLGAKPLSEQKVPAVAGA